MNLKQMEYFVAAAEQLNFTRAAKKCFISQTAMTLQIQSLEEKIGVPLFVRDKHHVELTAAEGIAGELTIGFIRGYEQSRFSETLRSFHEAYPNISIHLLRENMSALYELLDNGTCDLAFNLSLYTQNYEDLKHRFLKRFPMMAVLYPGHTLAGDSHLMYRDLAREDFIIMQPQGRSNDEAEEVLICYNKGGFIPNIVAREREVQTVLLEVSAGFGVAILPEYAVRYYRNARNLVVVPLLRADGSPEELDFEIAWRQSNPNPAIEKLLQWVETHEYVE